MTEAGSRKKQARHSNGKGGDEIARVARAFNRMAQELSARDEALRASYRLRRQMLAEHGKMAREYPDVRANTVASFALGDYEWMLAFEADELHRIVDLMRALRASSRWASMAALKAVVSTTMPRDFNASWVRSSGKP